MGIPRAAGPEKSGAPVAALDAGGGLWRRGPHSENSRGSRDLVCCGRVEASYCSMASLGSSIRDLKADVKSRRGFMDGELWIFGWG